jgi:hypothetical protein
MKRISAILLVALAFAPTTVHAQEPAESELELVQKLRGKGYVDLAKEYLEKMQKSGDPRVAALLPLEAARTLVALAREKEVDQRVNMIAAARAELEAYVKANAGKPEGAQAALELARLSSVQGQALLTQALREEDDKSAHERARPAEAMFLQAGKDLAAAAKALQAAAEAYKNDDPKLEKSVRVQLGQELLNARFDQGINLIDQARTYIDLGSDAINRKRAEIIEEARKIFDKLARDDATAPAGVLANAWLMKVSMEQQTPVETVKYYRKVLTQEGAAYQPARRWARLFFMQNLLNDPTYGKLPLAKKYEVIVAEGKSWLKSYPSQIKSREGQGVLYELGGALVELAKKAKDQKAKATLEHYGEAQRYYGLLGDMDGDLSQKAKQLSLALRFQLSGSKTNLQTFEDFYQNGMNHLVQWRQTNKKLADAAGKNRDTLDKQRKDHLHAMARALNKAVSLATSKTPIQQVEDARYNLTWAYILDGDLARAAIAGEALGRSRPPTGVAADGAAASLRAYSEMLDVDQDIGTQGRLKNLADYVLSPDCQKAWTGYTVIDHANYQLAMLAKRDDHLKDAIAYLEKVSPSFPGYTYAQGQLVFLAQEGREKATTLGEKKAFMHSAKAALKRMPPLGEKADPSTATMYFMAQMEMGKFLYSEAREDLKNKHPDKAAVKYQEMAKTLKELHDRFEKLNVKLENRERIEYTLGVLEKYADLGMADVEFNKGHYDVVLKATQKIVAKVLADAKSVKADGPIRYKDHQITGDLLGLALRAHIQKGEVEQGRALLGVLQRLQGEDQDLGGDRSNVVRSVLQEIEGQVKALKESGKKEDLEKLGAMVGNFTGFLDEIGKEQERKGGFDPEATRMLASAYASLDQHAKAAGIFAKVPAPKFLDNKKLTEDEAKHVAAYWGMQLQYAKALRQGKKKENLDAALKVLDHLLKHPNARYQILADMEKNFVLEDNERYSVALLRWGQFLKNPALARLSDPEIQKIYFNGAFYRIRTMYKYAIHEAKASSKEKFIRAAASQLMALEFTPDQVGWNIIAPMARALLDAEAPLREEYERLKKARENAGAKGAK